MKIELNTKIKFNGSDELKELIHLIHEQYDRVNINFSVVHLNFNRKTMIMISKYPSLDYSYNLEYCSGECCSCVLLSCRNWETIAYKSRFKKLKRILK